MFTISSEARQYLLRKGSQVRLFLETYNTGGG